MIETKLQQSMELFLSRRASHGCVQPSDGRLLLVPPTTEVFERGKGGRRCDRVGFAIGWMYRVRSEEVI
jgi:hypothetical protein